MYKTLDRRFWIIQGVGLGQALSGISTLVFLAGTGLSLLTLIAASLTAGFTVVSLVFLQGHSKGEDFP